MRIAIAGSALQGHLQRVHICDLHCAVKRNGVDHIVYSFSDAGERRHSALGSMAISSNQKNSRRQQVNHLAD